MGEWVGEWGGDSQRQPASRSWTAATLLAHQFFGRPRILGTQFSIIGPTESPLSASVMVKQCIGMAVPIVPIPYPFPTFSNEKPNSRRLPPPPPPPPPQFLRFHVFSHSTCIP